jgi:ketosteroid isomerase-like protein
VENRRVQSLTGEDFVQLDRLLSDDLTYTHSNGRAQSKAELLAALRSREIAYVAMNHEDVRVGLYGDTAVLTGRSQLTVRADGHEVSFPVRFTLVYVKGMGQWRMVAWQSTRAPIVRTAAVRGDSRDRTPR